MNEKDISAFKSVVINGIRAAFNYDEVALKIVEVSTRGSKAIISIVYNGKAPRAEVAAVAAKSIVSALRERFRLRKFTYIVLSVSKVSSRRSLKFFLSLRCPKKVYAVLPTIIRILRDENIVVRRWSLKYVGGSYPLKLSLNCSSGIPEINMSAILEKIRNALKGLNLDVGMCVDIHIKRKLGSISRSFCIKPLSLS